MSTTAGIVIAGLALLILAIFIYCIYWSIHEIRANRKREEEREHDAIANKYFIRKKQDQDQRE